MQCAPVTHEEGSTWPRRRTFVYILGNLSLPVVISEWHVVEVLTRFKHIRQAGIDAIHGGEPGSPEGKKIPPSVSRQNWGSESVTPQLCFVTPLLLQRYAQKGSRFTSCLKTENRLKPVALLWSNIV